MNVATEFDVGPLGWVKSEIDLALERSSQAMQQYATASAEGSADPTQIKFARTHLHQVQGALTIVGLDGVTQFTEALESLLEEFEQKKLAASVENIALVLRALDAIHRYLDDLINGQPNQPLRLLPLYREVQSLRGQTRVSASDLFYPDLTVRPPRRSTAPPNIAGDGYSKLLRQERARFQHGLLGWLRSPKDIAGVGEMLGAVRRIESVQETAAARSFWWVASGFLAALAEGSLPAEADAKQLCARIDLQIRRLLEGSKNVAERLMRDALYLVANAESSNEAVQQIKASYQLHGVLPESKPEISAPQDALRRRLREIILATEEAWNRFCAGSPQALPLFKEHAALLSATVDQLGHTDFRRLAQAVASAANWVAGKPSRHSESMAMEIATAILLAQNAQENYQHLGVDFAHQVDVIVARIQGCIAGHLPELGSEVPALDEMSRQAQEKLLLGQVAREIQSNLAHVEQVLDAFFRDDEKRADLSGLDHPLRQIVGALTMMRHDDAVEALRLCMADIKRFSDPAYSPEHADFERVAEQLSMLGFFIDTLQSGSGDYGAFVRQMQADPADQAAAAADEDEEEVDAREISVEQELEQQKRETQVLLAALKEQPADADLREELKQNLTSLQKDADLVADQTLGQQAKAALSALEAGGDSASQIIGDAMTTLSATTHETPLPSAETLQLSQASTEEIDAELLAIFLEEAHEVIGVLHDTLRHLRETPHDVEALTTVRRSFHTLKGSGRMVGLKDLGEAAWAVEQTLNHWLRQELAVDTVLFDLLEQANAVFSNWIEYLEGRMAAAPDTRAMMHLADSMRSAEASAVDTALQATPATPPLSPAVPLDEAPSFEMAQPDLAEVVAPPQFVSSAPEAAQAVDETLSLEFPVIEPAVDEEELSVLAVEPTVGETAAETGFDFDLSPLDEAVSVSPAEVNEFPVEEVVALPAEESAPLAVEEGFDSAATEIVGFTLDEGDNAAAEVVEALDVSELELSGDTEIEPVLDADIPLPVPEEASVAPPLAAPPEQRITVTPTLYDIFLEEALTHLATLQTQFEVMTSEEHNETPQAMYRAAHTLAGIAGTVGLAPVNRLGLALEHALMRRDHAARPDSLEAFEIIRQAIAEIELMLSAIIDKRDPESTPYLIDALNGVYLVGAGDIQPAASGSETPSLASGQHETTPAFVVETSHVKDELDEQLLPIFLEEAVELNQSIAQQLRAWRANPEDKEAPRLLSRFLHTLKGSARMAGAMSLGEITHAIESRVEQVQVNAAAEQIDEIDNAFDSVSQIIDRLQRGESLEPVSEPLAEHALDEASAGESVQEAPHVALVGGGAKSAAVAAPVEGDSESAQQRAMLRVRADLIDRLVNEAGELTIARSRIEGEMRGLKDSLLDLTENVIRLRRQLRDIEIQAESQMQSRIAHADVKHPGFDPLEFDRFTRFQELTRMMAESVNDVATVQQNLFKNLDDANAAIVAQARLNREVQQQLMSVRMVPFGSVADRLYRIVRQTAKELGKRANLEIRGSQVELDRSVLDKMAAPLEHMLRNAVAHGLEDRDVRLAQGKQEIGEIALSLTQEGNEIVLAFADDGAGLNFERIRARGIAAGLLADDEEADVARLVDLIFAPGFSTATELSQVAGRGIGMDIVKSEVSGLGGRIEVLSTPNKGTTFRIYIPLTLAVTKALIVRAGSRLYALPSVMIEQVLDLKEIALTRIRESGAAEWMGNRYPFNYLPRLLGDGDSLPEQHRQYWVLLLKSGNRRIAVQVDELRGNQEIVIKNIGPQLARVIGVDGATVLGDGQVVLILNPVALTSHTPTVALAAPVPTAVAGKASAAATLPTVMVVDDSLTVRKITGRLLAREGYEVLTAKDGVDALEQLLDVIPDVMLVDIEMPRMDGFDLTRNVRADSRLKDIPIIMITSRTADKHRNYALEIGVNQYLGKPYQEEELLGFVSEYVRQRRQV